MSLRYVARRASKVIAISDYVRNLLLRDYGVEADVIHNGVDTELFHPISPEEKMAVKDRLGIPRTEQVVLFVGRMYPYKDPLTLVRAIPKVVTECPSAVFTLVGDGPLKDTIESEIERMGLNSSVRLVPYLHRSKLAEWFQMADVFVSTSPTEMLGFSVLEAMSCAVPVVAAATGGPVEVLGRAGTFFKPSDENDLAKRILEIVQNGDPLSARGAAGREAVLRRFKWQDVAKRYANAYEDISRS